MASNLVAAKAAKNDEFYTQESDIAKEISFYRDQLRDKIIYCNCDNYHWSNFYKFFKNNFLAFGLKKLIASCYNASNYGEWAEFNGTVETTGKCESNGSFSDPDNIERLKEADIVITNPPFSLFRDFVTILDQYNKKFLIVGNNNAITYKEIFKLIKANKLWLGYCSNQAMEFEVPEGYRFSAERDGKKFGKISCISWFTNLDVNVQYKINRAKENLNILDPFYKYHYDPENYPKYDNCNAINVDRLKEIPNDYFGEIGVPITFLGYYDPNIWEIKGCTSLEFNKTNYPFSEKCKKLIAEGKFGGTVHTVGGNSNCYIKNDLVYVIYHRIIIKRK